MILIIFLTELTQTNSKTLDHDEVEKFFDSRGSKTPADLWKVEDKNGDGVIEWEEFTGPKGPSGDDDAFLRDENEHVVGDKPQEDL